MNYTFMGGFWFEFGRCMAVLCVLAVVALLSFIGACIYVLTSRRYERIKDPR